MSPPNSLTGSGPAETCDPAETQAETTGLSQIVSSPWSMALATATWTWRPKSAQAFPRRLAMLDALNGRG